MNRSGEQAASLRGVLDVGCSRGVKFDDQRNLVGVRGFEPPAPASRRRFPIKSPVTAANP